MADKYVARTFMYLDFERVRSLLSQLDTGLIETAATVQGHQESGQLAAEGGLPFLAKVSGSGNLMFKHEATETRSLHHYLYAQFENLIEEKKIVRDLNQQFQDESWQTGTAQSILRAGNLFMIKAPLSVFDYQRTAATLRMFVTVSKNLPMLGPAPPAGNRKGTPASGFDPQTKNQLIAVADIIEAMYSNVISVRVYPDGSSNPYLRGRLEPSYLHYRREDLIYLYGLERQPMWTTVGLIATEEQASTSAASTPPQVTQDLELSLENMVKKMLVGSMSLKVEPPAVGIIPIAIYAPVVAPTD